MSEGRVAAPVLLRAYLQTAASMTACPSSVMAGFAVTTHEVAPLEAGRTSVSEVAAYWHWSQ